MTSLIGRSIDNVIGSVDVDSIVARIDVDHLVSRIDWNKVLDSVDMDRQIARVDVNAILDRYVSLGGLESEDATSLSLSPDLSDVGGCVKQHRRGQTSREI